MKTIEFFDWNTLGSYTGAVMAVGVLTQISKEIPGIRRIPTQLWSYILAMATLVLSMVFTRGFSVDGAVLAAFNGAIVSLAANGGYVAIQRIKQNGGNIQE